MENHDKETILIRNGIIQSDEEWAYKQLYGDLFYCVDHYRNFHHQEFK